MYFSNIFGMFPKYFISGQVFREKRESKQIAFMLQSMSSQINYNICINNKYVIYKYKKNMEKNYECGNLFNILFVFV